MTENTTDQKTEQKTQPTWKDVLAKSEAARVKGEQFGKTAGTLLWTGAKQAIASWRDSVSDDPSAENLYNEVIEAMGRHRKSDASKIKTVALAAEGHNLDLVEFPNLAQAYKEAVRLTKTVAEQAAQDEAAEAAIAEMAAIVDEAVKAGTPLTPAQAATMVLAKGVDEAARLLLDALGPKNEAAHRSFLRALSAEVAGRVEKPVKAVSTGPKDGATQAVKQQASKAKATVKAQPAKPGKASPVKPPTATKASPVKRAQSAQDKAVAKIAAPTAAERAAKEARTEAEQPVKAAPSSQPVIKRPVPVKRG